jgi:hypothetical protein
MFITSHSTMSARVYQIAAACDARRHANQASTRWSPPVAGVDSPRQNTSFERLQSENAEYKHIHTWNTAWLAQVDKKYERLHWTNKVKVTYASDDDSDDDDDSDESDSDDDSEERTMTESVNMGENIEMGKCD